MMDLLFDDEEEEEEEEEEEDFGDEVARPGTATATMTPVKTTAKPKMPTTVRSW